MLARWKRLRLWIRLVALAGIVFVALAGAGYAYFALRTASAPAPASLGEVPKSIGGASGLNGAWVLAPNEPGFAGYRVREVLAVLPAPNDAVGRTTAVQARMEIVGGTIAAAE